jgi:hypothetical protein
MDERKDENILIGFAALNVAHGNHPGLGRENQIRLAPHGFGGIIGPVEMNDIEVARRQAAYGFPALNPRGGDQGPAGPPGPPGPPGQAAELPFTDLEIEEIRQLLRERRAQRALDQNK